MGAKEIVAFGAAGFLLAGMALVAWLTWWARPGRRVARKALVSRWHRPQPARLKFTAQVVSAVPSRQPRQVAAPKRRALPSPRTAASGPYLITRVPERHEAIQGRSRG